MTDPAARLVAELAARVEALEAWRAYQSDLLDELLNGAPDPPGRADGGEDGEIDDAHLDLTIAIDDLVVWVHSHVTSMVARPLRGELTWCPVWWEHTEAVFRFEALFRAWTELAAEPGTALSVWIRDHLDPCLRELLSPVGPFADCAHNERYRSITTHTPVPTLPTRSPT
ncbi:MAG: DUF4913 domain-containing protein [Pseudonocardiales bacterium]|nr:DUF4913 domain-containing protein [Pseudonocardiales bacterium]